MREMSHDVGVMRNTLFWSRWRYTLLLEFRRNMSTSIAFLFICLLGKFVATSDEDMHPPLDVTVKSITEHSFTLSWRASDIQKQKKLVAYSLTYMPIKNFGSGKERALQLPPTSTVKTVSNLNPGTKYAVILSSIYEGFKEVSAPKFTVGTKESDLPARDDTYRITEQDCNCSEIGTLDCKRITNSCNCHVGYTGRFCEKCSQGYYLMAKECRSCPCTKYTSTGNCTLDSHGNVECNCLPGHRGSDCQLCTAGYEWKENHCIPFNCYSNTICKKDKSAPGCEECALFEESSNHLPPIPHKSDRTIADGTVPLIAVVVTLGILVLVASIATCYRYWTIHRNRPRIPFWSIELQDDNPPNCNYQHLDVSTNKIIETPTSSLEAGKLYSPSSPKTYNAINV
ncbi:uncharacterized protein [Centruroides vittatus]|uniref:uncharacterized protein isoform X2 n=1 Tax=Centruroides vittatus TaxID=120091 RepID=UPI00350F0DE7